MDQKQTEKNLTVINITIRFFQMLRPEGKTKELRFNQTRDFLIGDRDPCGGLIFFLIGEIIPEVIDLWKQDPLRCLFTIILFGVLY